MKYQDKVDSMENKYYIPSIDEFYVGFEYEHCHSSIRFAILNLKTGDTSNIGEPKEIWEKSIFSSREYDIWESSFKFDDSLKNGQIRVKHLDREDIESLGFAQTVEDQYTLDDIEFLIDDDLFAQIIKDNGFLFQGTIKNKSELKRVLKMIGYEN